MPEESLNLDGSQMAAILLMTLGEDDAAQVLKHMGPKEVQKVGSTMATLNDVSTDQVSGVLSEFLQTISAHTALGVDSEGYIRRVLNQALGDEKAGGIIDQILLGGNANGLESLKWMEARTVAEMIRNEHPQIIAIVLSYLDSDQSASILGLLPVRTRVDVLMRVATLDAVQPAAINELNQVLEEQVSGTSNIQTASVGGLRTAAEILNFVDTSIESELMDQVNELDADIGQQIQDLMFVFDNLIDLDTTGIQTLMREVSSESLLLALKAADEPMKEKFFAGMSKRAAEMLRDNLASKGPVRLSEVEEAQKEIVTLARRLADEGQIVLGGKGAEEFI